jgi:hypothetical protein
MSACTPTGGDKSIFHAPETAFDPAEMTFEASEKAFGV